MRKTILVAICVAMSLALNPHQGLISRRGLIKGASVGSSLVFFAPFESLAVSGGGKDFAGSTIKGEDFSKKTYTSKDFSGVDAVGTNFEESILRGTRFFKADLAGADLSNADISAASFEGANLEGAKFNGVVAQGTAFSQTLEDVGDISNSDFTDAIMRPDVQKKLCSRPDAKGKNPKTGVDTRESLFCLD
mmetsp:Transcript_16352/g.21376  ORF Transcript_16352/g.21376 Transcript_16352/m.21376 type:complete len:191 (+) Transcript_16352:55-627(+)